jgi:glycosyltransferase involved in cell wall biosynthesis
MKFGLGRIVPPDRGPQRPLKVLRIVTRLNIGGVARHVTSLAVDLDPRFQTLLVHGSLGASEGDFSPQTRARGIQLSEIPYLQRNIAPGKDLRTIWELYRVMRSYRPDIVATHTSKAGILGRFAAVFAGVPVRVHTYHGLVLEEAFPEAMSTAMRAIERLAALCTTRLIAISPEIAGDLQRRGIGARKIVTISNGLELEPLCNGDPMTLRNELELEARVPLVGIVGRLVPQKGIATFIDAAAVISQQVPTAHFVVVGDGEERVSLERQAARLDLSDRVHFLGWRSDLGDLYAGIDIVVLTSKHEGTPCSLIEAGAAARPVVAVAVGGVPDVVSNGENGLLVLPGDTSGVASAVVALCRDPGRSQRMGLEGRRRAVEEHSVATMVREVSDLYAALSSTSETPIRGRARRRSP